MNCKIIQIQIDKFRREYVRHETLTCVCGKFCKIQVWLGRLKNKNVSYYPQCFKYV